MVFKKRQNIHYVKVQERIAALDGLRDYDLEITTVEDGGGEAVDHVVIYSKDHDFGREEGTEKGGDLGGDLKTAVQGFAEAEAGLARDLEAPPPVAAATATVASEPSLASAARWPAPVVLLRRPATPALASLLDSPCGPDLSLGPVLAPESVASPAPSSAASSSLVIPKPVALPAVRYRWQMGFRKAANGRYIKVRGGFNPRIANGFLSEQA